MNGLMEGTDALLSVLSPLLLTAAFDPWSFAQWAFNGIVTIALLYVAAKNREIDTLKSAVKQYADDLIGQKFQTERVQREAANTLLTYQLGQIVGRLEAGDTAFKELRSQDNQLKVEFIERLGRCATRDDLREDINELKEELMRQPRK